MVTSLLKLDLLWRKNGVTADRKEKNNFETAHDDMRHTLILKGI
jgi:hypothetical protein